VPYQKNEDYKKKKMLFKAKYRLNPDTLLFERVRRPYRLVFKKGIYYLLAVSAIAIPARFLTDPFFDSAKIRHYSHENELLRSNIQSIHIDLSNLELSLQELQSRDDQVYRSVLDLEPLPASIRKAGFGGSKSSLTGVQSLGDRVVETAFRQIDQLSFQSKIQSGSLKNIYTLAREQQKLQAHKPSIHPLSPDGGFHLSSTFGYRWDPFTRARRMHHGLDFAGPVGIPVYATGNGIVRLAEDERFGYGKQVLVNHGFGYMSRYAHLDEILVNIGDTVKRGQLIGRLGDTGRSTGPHLHYEVIQQGRTVNPFYYFFENLSPDEYKLIVEQAIQ